MEDLYSGSQGDSFIESVWVELEGCLSGSHEE